MVQGWKMLAGTLACMLAVVPVAPAQQEQQPAQSTQQDKTAQQKTAASGVPDAPSAIPDAPRPQTLPRLNTITPTSAAVTAPPPDAPTPQAGDADGQTTVGARLPSSAKVQTGEDAPDVPATGQGAKAVADLDTTPGPEPSAGQKSSLRVSVYFVEVPFTVKDSKGQLVPGLTPRDVRVYENGLRQQMKIFTVDPFPLSVALVIDQSVTQDVMTTVNNSLGALQGAFTPYDEVSVFTYNNGVKEQSAATAAQSARLGAVLVRAKGPGRESASPVGGPMSKGNYVNGHDVDPNTNGHPNRPTSFETPEKEFHTLNDAILAAARETTKAARGRRRIVYVISDGKEYGSAAKEKDVIKYCQTNKVSVWSTVVGESAIKGFGFLDRIHLPLTMRDDVLPRYASATGGQVDPEFRQKGIETSFAKITEEVRTQYTIGYYSHEPVLDGKYRRLEVRVARPNLTVIAKEGYYPSLQDSRPTPVTPTAIP